MLVGSAGVLDVCDLKSMMTTANTGIQRAKQAAGFIASCCTSAGAFFGPQEVHRYLKETAAQMAASKPSAVFPPDI